MIDPRYWTATERVVISDALRTERDVQRRRRARTRSPLVASDAQWRLVVIGQALDAVIER